MQSGISPTTASVYALRPAVRAAPAARPKNFSRSFACPTRVFAGRRESARHVRTEIVIAITGCHDRRYSPPLN
jgi:hypothetical protein